MHSSAVDGKFAGMQHKKSVMSAWWRQEDYRDLIFKLKEPTTTHQIDSKCYAVFLPNPRDFNLFMVQAGSSKKRPCIRVEARKAVTHNHSIKSGFGLRDGCTSHLVSVDPVRQEMLRQRKIAHGGHEVGDTHEDPLLIPSDEKKEAVISSPPKAEVDSPFNPNYDSDYQEFLTEFLADDSLGNTPPSSPLAATPDIIFPITPSAAPEADPPSPPSQTPSMVSADSPTALA
nr:U5 small nuclear ribonucleoprotein 40 kDa protein isoform X2 [Ipomoea batatas]